MSYNGDSANKPMSVTVNEQIEVQPVQHMSTEFEISNGDKTGRVCKTPEKVKKRKFCGAFKYSTKFFTSWTSKYDCKGKLCSDLHD